ncbi:MAG: glycosyltransferase family 4 protein [Betaproteobacteria bacterium]
MAARRRGVHQLLGALHGGDAVGNEAFTIRRHLRAAGFESEIVAGRVDPPLAGEARPLRDLGELDGGAAWLYHFSPGSPATAAALSLTGPLVLAYHNVTPARFFDGWSHELARLSLCAQGELRALSSRAALALAKSSFSRRDLEQAGFARCGLLPFVHELGQRPAASPVLRRLYGDGRTNLLSVGRLAPNKRVEDLLSAFAVLQRLFVPHSRLLVVGSRALEGYALALERRARELRLDEVVFLGPVDEGELRACYDLAAVYLSLSEHEGYGVPLVEAMLAGVPVVARDAGAVAETLSGAGLLLREPRPPLVAALVERVVRDGALRASVLAAQERVAERIRSADFQALLLGALAPVLEPEA